MPKNIWITKKRKRQTPQSAETIERSRMPDPNNPSIIIGEISDLLERNPVKKEEIIYSETRFSHSTTLFPAKGVEEPPESHSENLKRCLEEELITPVAKKRKEVFAPKTINSTTSDDCMIIENPERRVKIEIVDLTDDSKPTISVLCSPVKVSHRENRLADTSNKTIQANSDVRLKIESSEKGNEINANDFGENSMADTSNITTQANTNVSIKVESSGKRNEINVNDSVENRLADTSNTMIEANTNVRIKVESSEKRNEINVNDFVENRLADTSNTTIEANTNVRIKVESLDKRNEINDSDVGSANMNYHACLVKSEQNKIRESKAEVHTDKFCVDFNKNVDSPVNKLNYVKEKTGKNLPSININSNACIQQVNSPENLKSSGIAVSNQVDSVTRNKILGSELDIENKDNSAIGVNIKVERNENSSIIDYSASPTSFSSDANRANLYSVNREQTKLGENCEIDGNHTPVSKLAAKVKNEPEEMEFQKSFDNEKSQNNEDKSHKIIRNKNTVGVTSKTSLRNELDRIGISPTTKDSFASEMQFYEPRKFRTPLLKYFNYNKKVNDIEISHTLSTLNNLIENKDEINILEIEIIPDSIISQHKSEVCLIEKRKELPNMVNMKESLKEGKILSKISSPNVTESANSKQNISNSTAFQLRRSIKEEKYESSLNSFGNEMQQQISPNIFSKSHSKTAESNPVSYSGSPAIHLNSPVDIESTLDHSSSIILPSSVDGNEWSITANNLMVRNTKNPSEFITNDSLRQILNNVNSTKKSVAVPDICSTLQSSVNPVPKLNNYESISQVHQISSPINKPANERNSKRTRNISENILRTENVLKRSHGALHNPTSTINHSVELQSKRVKTCKNDSTSKKGNIKKLSVEEYIRRSAHNPPDHLTNTLSPDFPSNSSEALASASTYQKNLSMPPGNRQNNNFPVCSQISSQNTKYQHMVRLSPPQNPRLVRDNSLGMRRDMRFPKS